MKSSKTMIKSLFIVAIFTIPAIAQSDLRVPLSNPGEPGKLQLNAIYSDDIIIKTHEGNDVLFVFDGGEDEDLQNFSRDGMRRISRQGAGLEVRENGNIVQVKTSSKDDMDLEIWIPKYFSLQLNVTHGDVTIDGVIGEHVIKATNGDVQMTNVGGAVVVNSANGDILVDLIEVYPDVPMSFTGLNGDLEVSLPSDTKFTAKMKTDYGDVFTNFDMQIDRSSKASESTESDGTYSVVVNKWISGTINGGGPEYLFKTLHGDIEISKKQ